MPFISIQQNIVSKYAIQTLATYLMAQGHLCYHQEALNAG